MTLDREPERDLALSLREDSEPLRYLGSCTVSVEGPRLLRRLWVRDWTVITGFDGSAPFVGTLRLDGERLLLDDRNSGASFLLHTDSAPGLEDYVGEMVLVTGFAVGPQLLQVMGWRALSGSSGR